MFAEGFYHRVFVGAMQVAAVAAGVVTSKGISLAAWVTPVSSDYNRVPYEHEVVALAGSRPGLWRLTADSKSPRQRRASKKSAARIEMP